MPKKRILIISPINLYPTNMAFQDRIINLIRVLNHSHHVEVVALYNLHEQKRFHEEKLPDICEAYYLIPKPNRTFFQRKFYGILRYLFHRILKIPEQAIYPNWPTIENKILRIVNNNHYDIVQIEAWWQCRLFKKIKSTTFKVIDTHDVMYEKRDLERRHQNKTLTRKDKAFLENYKQKELEYTGLADLIISISSHDLKVFQAHFPNKRHILVPIGQNLSAYLNYPCVDDGKTILFYGSLGGSQNIIGFWRLYNNILPLIRKKIPDIKLIVLGSNPPNEILKLHDNDFITVTGFVSDVRPYLSKSTLMILPLETSGGFRGRVVEVMAMGVPTIGTLNALDCINMEDSVHGYITDDNEKIAEYVIYLLSNRNELVKMQTTCRDFVASNYSLENTYEKLERYYYNL